MITVKEVLEKAKDFTGDDWTNLDDVPFAELAAHEFLAEFLLVLSPFLTSISKLTRGEVTDELVETLTKQGEKVNEFLDFQEAQKKKLLEKLKDD